MHEGAVGAGGFVDREPGKGVVGVDLEAVEVGIVLYASLHSSTVPVRSRRMLHVRIVIAPDKFKGSLSAQEVADALADGLSAGHPDWEIVRVPIADGGDGTIAAFVAAGWQPIALPVDGPTGQLHQAHYAMSGETAVVELAAAVGLVALPEGRLDPFGASTVAIQTGENWWFPRGMANAIAAGASDLAMVDVMKIGGVTGWISAIGQAEAASPPLSMRTVCRAQRAPDVGVSERVLVRISRYRRRDPDGAAVACRWNGLGAGSRSGAHLG